MRLSAGSKNICLVRPLWSLEQHWRRPINSSAVDPGQNTYLAATIDESPDDWQRWPGCKTHCIVETKISMNPTISRIALTSLLTPSPVSIHKPFKYVDIISKHKAVEDVLRSVNGWAMQTQPAYHKRVLSCAVPSWREVVPY